MMLFDRIGASCSAGLIIDRKSTRLNSSHGYISYAVFCLKKKKKTIPNTLYPLLLHAADATYRHLPTSLLLLPRRTHGITQLMSVARRCDLFVLVVQLIDS